MSEMSVTSLLINPSMFTHFSSQARLAAGATAIARSVTGGIPECTGSSARTALRKSSLSLSLAPPDSGQTQGRMQSEATPKLRVEKRHLFKSFCQIASLRGSARLHCQSRLALKFGAAFRFPVRD